MKLKINKKISSRVTKRFKWMCIACIGVVALHFVLDKGAKTMQEFQFVEAGEDKTYEEDEVYSDYI